MSKNIRFLMKLLVLAAAISLIAIGSFGQSIVTGDAVGTVTDPSGAVVSGATVTITSLDTAASQTATTAANGFYRFPLLKPGQYRLIVKQTGFKSTEQTILVSVGQIATTNVRMELGTAAEVLEVTGEAPLIETENANLATTYSTSQLQQLPTPGGDITSYAYSAPGVTLNSAAGYGNFSSYGLPSTSNLFTTNGNDNMDPYLNLNNSGASNLSLGANELDQISIVQNGYTAQYGRQAGAQVNAATKSGTNSFHGNALYWWNGSNLNANDWFSNHAQSPRPFANNNQWAASFGGPIVKNKLFFFVDQEGLRFVLPGVSGNQFLPTTAFANYVLAHVNTTTPGSLPYYQNIFGLYAGSPGADRAVPVTTGDDPALGCGDFAGTAGFGPGGTPCARKFTSNQNNLNTEWLLTTRLDYNINSRDQLFGRFKTDHGVQATGTDPVNAVFDANSIQPAWEGQITETHAFGGNAVNQLIFSGSWYQALFTANNLPAALKTFPTTMGFVDGIFAQLGGSDNVYPQGRIVTQYQITDDFSKNKGAHDLKFGINFRRNLVSDYTTGVNTSGLLTISSMSEFVNGSTVNGFSDYSQAFSNIGQVRIKLYSLGLYAQDQWKASSKLAFTGAIRVDRNANPSCAQNCFSRLTDSFFSISHDPNQPYNSVIKPGQSNALPGMQALVFSPRVGLAYNIHQNTVLRGGIGLFTDLYPATIVDRFITNAPNVSTFDSVAGFDASGNVTQPYAIAPGLPNSLQTIDAQSNAAFQKGFANGATLADLQTAVPAGFNPPTFNDVGKKLLNPKFLEWNFELQQQLGNKQSISVNYVGNHGYDVMTDMPFSNAFCSGTGQSRGVCPFGGIYGPNPLDQRFAQVRTLSNPGWSNYAGLTASYKFQATKSFQGQFNYTWSHALDTCSNNCLLPFSANTVTSIRYQVSPTLAGTAYGNADYDVRQNFTANYIYNTPTNFSSPLLRHAVGGWSVAGTIFYHSGYPWTAVASSVRASLGNVTGLRTGTPIAQAIVNPSTLSCTNPTNPCAVAADFVSPDAQAGFGSYARNSFRGPGFFDTDMNITKNIPVGERVKFAIGANLFNLFNHPNFDLPVNNTTGSSLGGFGQIVNTVSPATSPYGAFLSVPLTGRIVQLNARVTF
jgi:Carboxypeptidase regulatory-like domain